MQNHPPQFRADAVVLHQSRPEATIRQVAAEFEPVMDKIRVPRAGLGCPRRTPDSVSADKAYSNGKIRGYLRKRGIRHVIPEKKDHKSQHGGAGHRKAQTVQSRCHSLRQARVRLSRHRHRCRPPHLAPIVTGAKTRAGRLVPRQGRPVGSGIEHGGDGFDLYELAVIAEHGDTHQCAGHVVVAERGPDNLPRGHQVLPPVGGDENARADDIVQ